MKKEYLAIAVSGFFGFFPQKMASMTLAKCIFLNSDPK